MDLDKQAIAKKALEAGIIDDSQWLHRLDEQVPLWLILDIALRLKDQLDPPHKPFD